MLQVYEGKRIHYMRSPTGEIQLACRRKNIYPKISYFWYIVTLFVNPIIFCADLIQHPNDFVSVIRGNQVTVDMQCFFPFGCQNNAIASKRTGGMDFPVNIRIVMERKMPHGGINLLNQLFLGPWDGKHSMVVSL